MTAIPPTIPAPHDPRGLGGLIALVQRAEVPMPLVSVRVRTHIMGNFARSIIEQRFKNGHNQPVEAVHIFPLPEDGAVVEMELRCGETIVKAECRERAEAEASFDAARKAGHRAALLTQERADIHTFRVTNLPPDEEVVVRIVVIEHLESEDGLVRFRFPTTVAPRYMPGTPATHSGSGVAPDTDRVPDASRISPPIQVGGGTLLDLEVSFDRIPSRLACSLHAIRMELEDGLRVAPNGKSTCDRDFILAFAPSSAADTVAEAWTDGEHTLVVVQPPTVTAAALPRDAIFVVDISGSMGGPKMDAAKLALRTAVRGLNPGDRFRVIAFDDRVEEYRPDFVPFGNSELAGAEKFIARLAARGGTEMKAPLVRAFAGDRPASRLRTILFVTDGQAGNDVELLTTIANQAKGARLFPLGIDTAVNGQLLKQFARVGNGACTLCTPDDDIEAVVARIEARFGSPVADQVRVAGEAAVPGDATVFAGKPLSLWVRGSGVVKIAARIATGHTEWTCTPMPANGSLAAGYAKARVAWLEDRLATKPFEEEAIKPEIIRVALAGGIASRFTAFVAVETSRTISGERIEVVQPAELPHMWEESNTGSGVAGMVPGSTGAAPMMLAGAAMSYGSVMSGPGGPSGAGPALPNVPARMMARRPAPRSPADHHGEPAEMAAPPPPMAAAPKVRAAGLIDAMRSLFSGKVARDEGLDMFSADAAAPGQSVDPLVALVQSQDADGSWAGDLARTVAALRMLMAAGHTRLHGLRKRSVTKAANWLARRSEAEAIKVLAELAATETALG